MLALTVTRTKHDKQKCLLNVVYKTLAKYSRSSYLHIFRPGFLDYAHKPGRRGGVEGARAERVGKKERRRAQRHGNQLIRDNSPFPLSLSPICPTTADSRCYVIAQHLTRE